MKFFDLFRRFSRRTITGASLPLAAGFLLWAAPLRAEFVYLSNGNLGVGNITTYAVGSNGVLSQVGSPLSIAYVPSTQAMDPKGRFLFLLDSVVTGKGDTNRVWAYSIGSNGALTQAPGSPVALGTLGYTLNVDPSGKFLYVIAIAGSATSTTISGYSIGFDGTLTAVKGSPFTIAGVTFASWLTFDPTGKFLYANGNLNGPGGAIAAYRIESNGALTLVPGSPFASGTGTGDNGGAVDPTGRYYFTYDNKGNTVLAYTIGSNGALTPVSGSPFATGRSPIDLTVSPNGQFVYVPCNEDNTVWVYSNTSGSLAPISGSPFAIPVTGLGSVESVTLDPTGRFAYVDDVYNGNVFTYSIGSDGGLTYVTTSTIQVNPLSISFVPLLAPFVYVEENIATNNDGISAFTTDPSEALLLVPGSPFPTLGYTNSAAVDPTGNFVYVPNENDNSLSVYSIGTSGFLTLLSTVATGNAPFFVAPDPAGRYLYVTNYDDNTVSAYTVGSTGTLTPITGSPFATGTGPAAVTVDRAGKFVYVTNDSPNALPNTVSAYTIGSTGALTPVKGSPFPAGTTPSSMAVDPVGNFAYVANMQDNTVSAYRIGSNGALTPVSGSPFATGHLPASVTVDPKGLFVYVTNELANNVSAYSIGSNGALTPVPGSPFAAGINPNSVAVDSTSSYAYVTNTGDNSMSVYTIGSNGALTPISESPFTGLSQPISVAVSPIPFATSTTSFETEAGKTPTFTLDDTFTLGRNSTGIDPVTQQVTLRIDNFAVTIPANRFSLLTDGTFEFGGIINNVLYYVTITPLGGNTFKLSAEAGKDLSTLGKNVSIALMVGGNAGTSTASHKQ